MAARRAITAPSASGCPAGRRQSRASQPASAPSSAQSVAETAVGGDALRVLGARGEPGFDLGPALDAEAPVGVGLQVGFRDGGFRAHFTTLSLAAAPWPSIIMRNFSRARDNRDITVPIGMPRACATSS